MANTYRNDGLTAESGSGRSNDAAACQASELKDLLGSLLNQVSDADRRHSEALTHMQDRLASLGRDAQNLRDRVPDRFLAAFERIEAGMSDLAANIATGGDGVAASATATTQNPLRSNVEKPAFAQAPSRTANRDDTFDVVELSSPSSRADFETDADDGWDAQSADALAGVYDAPSSNGFSAAAAAAAASQPFALASGSDLDLAAMTSGTATMHPAPSSFGGVGLATDHAWFETRFAEITRRIDESLADLRPDQSFLAIGQRLDGVEQSLAQVIEATAAQPNGDGLRIIESHIGELAGHLDHTLTQLGRLDAIEGYLTDINDRLIEVHQIAQGSTSDDGSSAAAVGSGFDPHEIARAAVDEAASRFASFAPTASAGSNDMRPLFERFMSESRQGEENTHALLDTLQQAMIRLLDRVDNIEMSQHQTAIPERSFADHANPYATPEQRLDYAGNDAPVLDAAVAAVAAQRPAAVDYTNASPLDRPVRERMNPRTTATVATEAVQEALPSRDPNDLRQDFIADARRARAKLTGAGVNTTLDAGIDRIGDAVEQGVASSMLDRIKGGKASKSSKGAAADAGQPSSTARIAFVALAALIFAGGGWYVLNEQRVASDPTPVAIEDAAPQTKTKPTKDAAAKKTGLDSTAQDGAVEGETLRQPDGTRGEIVPDNLLVGESQVPLHGITVETNENVQAAEFERAQRRQQLATLSNKIGDVAAKLNNGIATPTSLIPGADESAAVVTDQAVAKAAPALARLEDMQKTLGGGKDSSALDMPPAIVGPLSLRLAAANGDPSAEFDVGARLAEGRGGSQNFKDAAKWYQRSADRGFAQSQYRLGTLYERGLGLKADPARAREWYERAAQAGNVKAMHNLAVLSANQAGGSPDYASAAEWFTKASEHGLSDSQFNLAVLYENGLGVEANLVESFKWLSIAARGGDGEAVRRRDIQRGKLTAEQIKQADGLIAAWRSKPTEALVNDVRAASEAWKKNPANGVNG